MVCMYCGWQGVYSSKSCGILHSAKMNGEVIAFISIFEQLVCRRTAFRSVLASFCLLFLANYFICFSCSIKLRPSITSP